MLIGKIEKRRFLAYLFGIQNTLLRILEWNTLQIILLHNIFNLELENNQYFNRIEK